MNRSLITRTVTAFGLVVFAVAPLFAQVQVGVRGGAHWGTVSEPSILQTISPTLQFSPGPTAALFLEIPLTNTLSFRPEVAYIQKGVVINEGTTLNIGGFGLPIGARVAYQTQNIEVPLLLKATLSDGPVQPYIFGGPAISYTADGRIRSRATALFTTKPIDIPLTFSSTLNAWDFSAVGGLGLAMSAGPGKFFVEGRYEQGFTRQIQLPVVNLPVRNRGFSMSLGYSFPLN